MASKRFQFSLNTSKQCFLCCKKIQEPFTEDDFKERKFSLRSILRYLKINLSQVSSLSGKPTSVLNKTDVQVSLCSDCERIVQKFEKHYEDLKVSKMKVESSLEDILTKLESKRAVKVHCGDGEDAKHSKIVDELRQKVKNKSRSITKKRLPRVILRKVNARVEKISIPAFEAPSFTPVEDVLVADERVCDPFEQMEDVEEDEVTVDDAESESFPEIEAILETKPMLKMTTRTHYLEQFCDNERIPTEVEQDIEAGEQTDSTYLTDPLGESIPEVEANQEPYPSLETNENQPLIITSGIPQQNNPINAIQDSSGVELKVQECRFCKKIYLWPDAIKNHLQTEHLPLLSPADFLPPTQVPKEGQGRPSSFQCKICHKEFKREVYLKLHSKRHELQCGECYKMFKTKHGLTKHVWRHFSKNKHQCKICHKICTTRRHLDLHLVIHQDEK